MIARNRFLFVSAITVPFAVLVGVVAAYGYRAPYWDEYGLIDVMDQYARGELPLSNLWTAYSAHRAPVASAVVLGLAQATHFNHAWFLGLTVFLATLTFVALATQLRRTNRALGTPLLDWRIPLIALMVFSLSQWQIYLWGHLLLTYLCVFGSVLSLVCLDRTEEHWSCFAVALLAGIAASFTYGAALAVWPAGALHLFLLRKKLGRRMLVALPTWGLGATAVLLAFFHDNPVAAKQATSADAMDRPVAFAQYVCTYLGGAIMSFSEPGAMCVGGVALIIAMALAIWAVACRDVRLREAAAPYIALIVFGVAAAAATGIERLDQGRCQALSSRYIAFSNLFYIGMFMATWIALQRPNARRILRGTYTITIWGFALLVSVNAVYGLFCADERHDAFAPAAQAFKEGRDMELWGRLFPRPDEMPRYREILQRHHMSIFRDNTP